MSGFLPLISLILLTVALVSVTVAVVTMPEPGDLEIKLLKEFLRSDKPFTEQDWLDINSHIAFLEFLCRTPRFPPDEVSDAVELALMLLGIL